MEKIKLLYLTPHLSTGGMPQFVLKRIESLQKHKDLIDIYLVEYSQFSDTYIVQRNKIIDLLDEGHFFSLGWFHEPQRKHELIKIIKDLKIDIVHIEEITEGFESFNKIPNDLLNQLYDNNRTWKIVETCHNIWFNPDESKKYHPEYYCFVTPYHELETFKNTPSNKKLILYPYEDMVKPILNELDIHYDDHRVPLLKKVVEREKLGIDIMKSHVLNIGLWTEGKNQREGVEVARLLQDTHPNIHFHFVGNQAENFEKYWGPIMSDLPKNVTVWGERNDIDTFMKACDVLMFNSTWECNPLVIRESIGYGLKILTRDLPQYMGMYDNYITPIKSNDIEVISNQLVKLVDSDSSYKIEEQKDFGDEHLSLYRDVMNTPIFYNEPIKNQYRINQHFVVNPYLDITGNYESKFDVKVYNNKTNDLVYGSEISMNSWVKLNREYYTEWRTEIRENGNLIYNNILDLSDKRVYISFGSKSLGDTLAWFPYCEEFRKKHNCKLIVSTFLNHLFIDQYPEIEFVDPGDLVPNVYAQYRLGWYYTDEGTWDKNKHPNDFKTIPLQKTASDILGLDYSEIRPNLKQPNVTKRKKVGIGFHSTAQAKYWNRPNGWQEVVNYLNGLGYECVIYSKEGDGYMGNNYPEGVSTFEGNGLQEVINDLSSCEFFIGLGSGLSWLAWACKLPVVLISGFSEKWAEIHLDTYRVINESVCHGCFNWSRLDAGDWNWCPEHKGTDRQFECTKTITPKMVIKQINKVMNIKEQNDTINELDWGKKTGWFDFAVKEIFEDNTYGKVFQVEEGDVVVDIGASLGPFTYSILKYNPKECYVVEPLSNQIELLKKNVGRDNVKIIQGAITDKKKIEITWDDVTESVPTFTFKEFITDQNIKHIDFLKCDCEGGEYDVFQPSNVEFLKTIPKIVTEFHLKDNEEFHQCRFRWFRDNILPKFNKYEIYSVDGVDIKWNLWNDHFIEYYNEVIIHIDNR